MKFIAPIGALVIAGGMSVAPMVAGTGGSAAAAPPPGVSVSGLSYAPAVHLPGTHLPHAGLENMTYYSGNWSGYVDIAHAGKAFSYAATTFTIPVQSAAMKAQCNSASQFDSSGQSDASYWVGLDGWTNGTVEQTGVDSQCYWTGTKWVDAPYAWYEMYPAKPVALSGVNPGDKIAVSVTYKGSQHWLLVLKDLTNHRGFSVTAALPSGNTGHNSSAEVITETPGGGPPGGVFTASFGRVSYVSTAVKSGSVTGRMVSSSYWSGGNVIEERGASGGDLTSVQSALGSGGSAFTSTWKNPF